MSLVHVLAFTGLIAFVLFAPLLGRLHGEEGALAAAESASQLLYLHDRFWIVAAFGLVVVALDAIRVSHRFSGPIYRMTKSMREAATGRIPAPIRLRRGDYLHREVDVLNDLFAYASELRDELERAMARLDAALARVEETVRAGADGESPELAELRAQKRHLEEILDRLDAPSDRPAERESERETAPT